MTESDFNDLVSEITRQGYEPAEAARLARLIGDTPVMDEQGRVVVFDGEREVARLQPLKFFGD